VKNSLHIVISADCGKIRQSHDGGEGHVGKASTRLRLKLEHLYTCTRQIVIVENNSDQLCKLSQSLSE